MKHEGIRGLYKGTLIAVIGVSNGAIQFMVYEELKKRGRERKVRQKGAGTDAIDLVSMSNESLCSPEYLPHSQEQFRIHSDVRNRKIISYWYDVPISSPAITSAGP